MAITQRDVVSIFLLDLYIDVYNEDMAVAARVLGVYYALVKVRPCTTQTSSPACSRSCSRIIQTRAYIHY